MASPLATIDVTTARDELRELLHLVNSKADRNEHTAQRGTAVIVLASALVPVLLLCSTEWQSFLLGQLIPSVISACAAGAAGLLQFRRPYAVWALYRALEGEIRAELRLYDSGHSPYADEGDREERLAETVASFDRAINQRRLALVPADAAVFGERPPFAVSDRARA